MLSYPEVDPIVASIGPVKIYWYGVSYLLGFLGSWLYLIYIAKKQINQNILWTKQQISDLIFYTALGVIFGGRIGFVLFYQPEDIFLNPWTLLQIQQGRSFHGGLLGVLLALFIFSKKNKFKFFQVTDFVALATPIGLGFGRLGNFINGELWGRTTDLPWGMVFPHVDLLPRHPSQLYEFLLEGVFLFWLLYFYNLSHRCKNSGQISGMFLFAYGLVRFVVEFVREPDIEHGFIAFEWLTMGQIYSVPMVILGIYLLLRDKKQ